MEHQQGHQTRIQEALVERSSVDNNGGGSGNGGGGGQQVGGRHCSKNNVQTSVCPTHRHHHPAPGVFPMVIVGTGRGRE